MIFFPSLGFLVQIRRSSRSNMEKRRLLLSVTLVSNFVVLFPSFTGVTSAPITNITSMMNNKEIPCEASRFLYNSTYVRGECANTSQVINDIPSFDFQLGLFLCLGVYDTMYKICNYSSQNLIPNISLSFDSYMKDQVRLDEKKFCEHLKGYSSLHKIEHLQVLVKKINTPDICMKYCFDDEKKLHPSCMVLDWIKGIDEYAKKVEARHNATSVSQAPNDKTHNNDKEIPSIEDGRPLPEAKKTEEQVSAATVPKSFDNVNDKSNAAGDASNAAATDETEKNKSKLSKDVQKKVNKAQDQKSSISSTTGQKAEANVEVAEPAKNIAANTDSQVASVKNPAGKAASKDVENQGNVQNMESKEQEEVRSSTISDNTQDHYDVNPDEDVDPNKGDNMDGTDIFTRRASARFISKGNNAKRFYIEIIVNE